tara:strand:- start:279 stop:620 length:342 start_codon:yes stop_codon:yes gene_type:complete
MGFGSFFKGAGKAIGGAANTVGNGIADGANAAWDGTQKGVICLNAINNVRGNVQGHDPRTWMTACAKQTIFKMQGPDYFKKCLKNKIKQEIKDIKDPQKYVDSLWDEIKDGCS